MSAIVETAEGNETRSDHPCFATSNARKFRNRLWCGTVAELIRTLVGLDREAATDAFAEFLDGSRFNVDQIRFVTFIIDYLTENGVMPADRLYQPPCTDFHPAGLDGVFPDADATRIVDILKQVRQNTDSSAAA